MFISTTLKFYKREDIQNEILRVAEDREVAVRYNDRFGKRPDTLNYNSDILAHAKRGTTSFHCSEERWYNPLQLGTNLKPIDLDELRKGWDLVLDIDCPNWDFSKLTAHLVVKALQAHNIVSISAKFSGNKGFHIAVPFEAFPDKIGGKDTKKLFPEAPMRIAKYLLDYIRKFIEVKGDIISFDGYEISLSKLHELFPDKKEELVQTSCKNCKVRIKADKVHIASFDCVCGYSIKSTEEKNYLVCPKCSKIIEKKILKSLCNCSPSKVNPKKDYISQFNPFAIIELDTLLISSRHLFRMPFSFHEKSQLVSVPIPLSDILTFNKESAKPDNVKILSKFLDKDAPKNQTDTLVLQAYDFNVEVEEEHNFKKEREQKEYDEISEAISEELFPPCIKNILKGIEDGKKRAIFVLSNFLLNVGWNMAEIRTRLDEWNKLNVEELRQVYINGQLRYKELNKNKKVPPPPNCDNKAYYKDMRVCTPDEFCRRVKNPLMYTIFKSKDAAKNKKVVKSKNAKAKKDSKKQIKVASDTKKNISQDK